VLVDQWRAWPLIAILRVLDDGPIAPMSRHARCLIAFEKDYDYAFIASRP